MLDSFVADLRDDHLQIEAVLNELERQLASPLPFSAVFLSDAIQFLAEFADEYHHFKEEDVFFPFLASQLIPVDRGPIAHMIEEHAQLRQLLAGIRGALPAASSQNQAARQRLHQLISQYSRLLRKHMEQEEHMQFESSRRFLTQDTGLLLGDIVARRAGARLTAARLAQLRMFSVSCQNHRAANDFQLKKD